MEYHKPKNLTLEDERHKSQLESTLGANIRLQRFNIVGSNEWKEYDPVIKDLATQYLELTGTYYHSPYIITENID